tara:strand:+ start:604 stop:1656 length:1053 start_codon:yes stop_codon:yes gene_type:complete
MKKVLVTGTLGQDGANMCEFLLNNTDYKVFGMIRRAAIPNFENCKNFLNNDRFKLVYGDLTDEVSISNLVEEIKPDFFINFAANSFVGCSWTMPLQVFDTNATGVLRCLEAIKNHNPKCKFYSAGSSEEFGNVDYSPQDIKHPLKPRSPYGASKCAARHIVKVYRESYDMFAVHGTLFNHEGTKRGEEFVTRKITKGVAKIKKQIIKNKHIDPIELGNIYSKRDWSDSEDFVKGVWLMLNQEKPKDYLLASGETHTIKEFVERAFLAAKIEGNWSEDLKDPLNTKFHRNSPKGEVLMKINPEFYRPAEVELLLGDPTDIKLELGWKPEVSFCNLVKKMVQHDLHEEGLQV